MAAQDGRVRTLSAEGKPQVSHPALARPCLPYARTGTAVPPPCGACLNGYILCPPLSQSPKLQALKTDLVETLKPLTSPLARRPPAAARAARPQPRTPADSRLHPLSPRALRRRPAAAQARACAVEVNVEAELEAQDWRLNGPNSPKINSPLARGDRWHACASAWRVRALVRVGVSACVWTTFACTCARACARP